MNYRIKELKRRHNRIKARIKHGIATVDEKKELKRIRMQLGYDVL